MKSFSTSRTLSVRHLLAGLIFTGSAFSASAQVAYVGTLQGSQMPGSPTDFAFVGVSTPANLPSFGGTDPGTTVLTDFSLAAGHDVTAHYSDNTLATINAPAGYVGTPSAPSSVPTGVVFANGNGGLSSAPDLLTFTLQNSPSFDYSDFYVLVMYNNDGHDGPDSAVDLTLTDSTGVAIGTSVSQSVTDTALGLTTAKFAEFHVTGAESFDMLNVGAESTTGNPDLGGVSFSQTEVAVPEPSTWAMMGFGATFLLWRMRRKSSLV